MANRPSPAREGAGTFLTNATLISFAGLLFVSSSMWQWLDVERRVPPLYAGYTDFYFYASDLFLIATVVLGLLAPLAAGRRLERGPWYFTLPLAALVGLSFASALTGVDTALTLYHSVRFLLLFGLYVVIVNTRLPAKWVAVPLALAVMAQSSVAILQFLKQGSLGLQSVGELTLDPAATGTSILRIGDERILRAYGLSDHPNLLGGFLAFALIIILGYYLDLAKSDLPTSRRNSYLLLVPLVTGTIALFYTFSRAAQLALACGVVVLLVALVRERPQRFLYLRALGIAAGLVFAALLIPIASNEPLIALRAGQENAFEDNVSEARSLNERNILTESANRVFYQRQILGVGNGALALGIYKLDKDFPRDEYDYQPAHLVALVAAAELGLFGGFVWIWLMLAPLLVAWTRRSELGTSPWKAGITAAIVILLVIGFFDYYPWLWQSGRIWQWSAWGLFAAAFAAKSQRS